MDVMQSLAKGAIRQSGRVGLERAPDGQPAARWD